MSEPTEREWLEGVENLEERESDLIRRVVGYGFDSKEGQEWRHVTKRWLLEYADLRAELEDEWPTYKMPSTGGTVTITTTHSGDTDEG